MKPFSSSLRLAALAPFALAPALAVAQAPARVAVPGPNPQWDEVNQTDTGRGYVDRNSIRREGGRVLYMGRIVFDAPGEDGATEILHRGEIDCAGNRFRILAFDTLGADGRLLESMVNDQGELPDEPINAGSVNERLRRDHCG